MMDPMKTPLFKDLNDILKSNYLFVATGYFVKIMRESNNSLFMEAKEKGRILTHYTQEKMNSEISKVDFAIAMEGFRHEAFIPFSQFKPMYKTQESMFTGYYRLDVGALNPLIEKLQRLMDLSADHGLLQAWEGSWEISWRKVALRLGLKRKLKLEDIKATLNLSQILPICVVLLIGLGVALIVFIFEVFYHDFVSQLDYYVEKMKINQTRRKWKVYGRVIAVRKI